MSRRDAPAFDPAPFGAELRAFVRRMGGGQEADDVVQETFLRAVRAAAPARPRAWLYGVALNVLRDRSRSSGRARIDADPERLHAIEERSDGPAESAIARETSIFFCATFRHGNGPPDSTQYNQATTCREDLGSVK